jgi:centrosomal protein CEP19
MNLNKLDDVELAAYKRAMDKDFGAKQLKPGDTGFVYDKVVEFKKNEGPIEDDSWGESDGVAEDKEDEEEYYYDEEEEEVQ